MVMRFFSSLQLILDFLYSADTFLMLAPEGMGLELRRVWLVVTTLTHSHSI